MAEPDRWSRWLLERRDAGSAQQREAALEHLIPVRDRVLEDAGPLDGTTVLDVGTGDGLIALEALRRVGPRGRVIFADVSEALLEHCRQVVAATDAVGRARFVLTSAEDLAGIADATVDVVTARSVLIYVADRARAVSAMHRVLRVGGRVSLFEPVNRRMFPEPHDRFWGYDVTAVAELAAKVKAAFDHLQEPAAATLMDFDERELVPIAEAAGFERVRLETLVDAEGGSLLRPTDLDALLDAAPNPYAPTIRESIGAGLTEQERDRFVRHLQRAVAEDGPRGRSAAASLTARRAG